jgi:hypothetical protein
MNFADTTNVFPFISLLVKQDLDNSRRKVIQYNDFVDRADYASGHGTHVCGTVAGNKASDGKTETNGMANGVAKEAKLAFYDIGHPGKLRDALL